MGLSNVHSDGPNRACYSTQQFTSFRIAAMGEMGGDGGHRNGRGMARNGTERRAAYGYRITHAIFQTGTLGSFK